MPCFVDRDGQACAVAYLLVCSGQQSLVAVVAKTANHALVADIHAPEFEDWMATSGLTRAELARIQPDYGGDEELLRLVGYLKLFTGCVIVALLSSVGNIIQFVRGFGRSVWLGIALLACLVMYFSAQRVVDLDYVVHGLKAGVVLLRPNWDLGWAWPWSWLNHVPAAKAVTLTLFLVNSPALFLPRKADKVDFPLNYRLAALFLVSTTAFLFWAADVYRWCAGQPSPCTFARVRAGMSVDEVETLLGPPGLELGFAPSMAGIKPLHDDGTEPRMEGDRFFAWDDGRTLYFVSFKDNAVKNWHRAGPYNRAGP